MASKEAQEALLAILEHHHPDCIRINVITQFWDYAQFPDGPNDAIDDLAKQGRILECGDRNSGWKLA